MWRRQFHSNNWLNVADVTQFELGFWSMKEFNYCFSLIIIVMTNVARISTDGTQIDVDSEIEIYFFI